MSMVMDFDQSFTGPGDWSFPSPNVTPNHHAFGHDIFHTPKTTTLPSHFQDAFTTPQMQSYATPRLQNAVATPQQYPRSDFASQSQHAQVHTHSVQPSFETTSQQSHWHPQLDPEHVLPSNTPSTAQTQTPPPTRHSDARKIAYQPVAFGTPSTIVSRRHMTPQHQAVHSVSSDSQEQALQLQFPQVTQPFSNTGPATAPVRSAFGWHPDMRQVRHPARLEDPFMSNMPSDVAWSIQGEDFHDALASQLSQSMASTAVSSASMHMTSMSGSVDPSLVYTSPVHLFSPVTARPRSAMPGSQTEQRRRVSANNKHARTDTASSGESAQLQSSTLRRSNTTGSARSTATPTDIFSRVVNIPRTASPLKRVGRTPLGSISEMSKQRQRSSVILTVDENGLARTETQGDSPTRSMRARYPGLFDSDSSDPESEGSPEPASRRASFTFNRRDERKQKALKLDPPIEKFESLSIPRSSSSASLRATVTPSRAAVAAAAQLRRQGSLRRTSSLRQSQSRNRSAAPMDTCPMNIADEQSWIAPSPEKQQFEFAPVNNRRTRPPRAVMQNTLDAHNRRWSMMSVEQHGVSHGDVFLASSQGQQLKKMRCVCGVSSERGQAVVQCAFCTQWSHVACVGLEQATIPTGFTCPLCTKPMQV